MNVNQLFDMQPSAAMMCRAPLMVSLKSRGERKMKYHTNDMFFSLIVVEEKKTKNLSLLFALLSKSVNLQPEGDVHTCM